MTNTANTVNAGASTPSVDETLATLGPAVLAHMNASYDDSLLLVARILGERRTATAARAVAVDIDGIDFVVTDAEGDHDVHVSFAAPITDAGEITTQAMALVARARRESGEPGETSAERQMRLMSSIRTFVTSVSAVEDVHPHLRKITFAGGDLTTFSPLGPDTFLYVLLPPPGRDELTIDQTFTWAAYNEMPEAERPVGAYYTLRAWRPATAELDMLFVLHEPAGPASRWAATAEPGDQVALWGPREAFTPPAGSSTFLLVADETGLPAVATILESLSADQTAIVVAEVGDVEQRQELLDRDGITVHWVHRDGAPAGTVPALLADRVREVVPDAAGAYAWGGGESRAMTAVRKHLRRELGWSRDAVSMVAYWRHADSPIETDEG